MKIPEDWGDKRDWRPWLTARVEELSASMLFSTRLPLNHAFPAKGISVARATWALPLAGIVVGVAGALAYALAHWAGLPRWPAAALAIAATLAVTGCLHEDALADAADGFGGGETRERKLDIMHDSRTGAYGVCALVLSLLIRVSVLAGLANVGLIAAALIAAHGAARAAMPIFMFFVPPARTDGLSYQVGQPPPEHAAIAAVLGFVILIGGLGFSAAIIAAIALVIVIALMAWLSRSQIGGQTGDVVGALEQVSEIVILLVAVR